MIFSLLGFQGGGSFYQVLLIYTTEWGNYRYLGEEYDQENFPVLLGRHNGYNEI